MAGGVLGVWIVMCGWMRVWLLGGVVKCGRSSYTEVWAASMLGTRCSWNDDLDWYLAPPGPDIPGAKIGLIMHLLGVPRDL
jgi:hypothetical protein